MKDQKPKSANKTVYIDHWLNWFGEPNNDGVTATKLPDGRWACEIELPLINQTIKSVARSPENAMENVSSKAIPLVDKYLLDHPETKFISRSVIHHYEFFTDERGFTGFRRNPEYRRKTADELLKMQLECAKAIEKAVSKIKKVIGTDKNLFVQVIDKSYFEKDDTIEDIQRKISCKLLGETSDHFIMWETTSIVGNCVVAIGYITED